MTAQAEAGSGRPLDVFFVAGERSGDELGGRLIEALRARCGARGLRARGVGGPQMAAQGLVSLFPLSDIAIMGFLPVLANLKTLLARIGATADAAIARPPDLLVIIDSPDFTHRVARRIRARLPNLPVVDYVSPTVWAWRPGRAKAMTAYVDRVLALLPFEPDVYRRLAGPPCDYIGHPLIERLTELTASDEEARARETGAPSIVILPGSRRFEIERLLETFGRAVAIIARARPDATFVLPAVAHLESDIRAAVAAWPVQPRIVAGEQEKFAAFRRARAALAASGTVSLELSLAGVPMAIAYRALAIEAVIMRIMVTMTTATLANLILGRNVVPEFFQRDCNPVTLAAAILALLPDGELRAAQTAAFEELRATMRLPAGETPSSLAAALVLDTFDAKSHLKAALE